MSTRYKNSEAMLREALEYFPTGTQTAMKSAYSFPVGISPLFVQKAQGARIWDVDGNEYIDFVGALGPITLGYNDPDVLDAVREQLEIGPLFSLSHPLELEVARLLVEMVPCCEMVRFGKNGNDMTSTAVRLARAITGREHVAFCGYHGWADWSVAATAQNAGVPDTVKALSHPFKYNDVESLESIFLEHAGQIAVVILEPMRMTPPQSGFLESVRDLCDKNGSILVFDEIVTGFRLACGGSQELFGITPDLAVFAKGMSNGYPLSALVGRKEFMKHLSKVHASLTYGGDAISLAAAKATLEKYRREPVIETIKSRGKKLADGIAELVAKHVLEDVFITGGDPSFPFMMPQAGMGFSEPEIRTLFLQEVFERGFLVLGAHAIFYAHTDNDIGRLLETYDEVMETLSNAIREKTLLSKLKTAPPQHSTTNWR